MKFSRSRSRSRSRVLSGTLLESLESRVLLCASPVSYGTYAIAVPNTPISTLSVDIEAAPRGQRGVTITTIVNGGPATTTKLSKIPSEIDITSPQVGGLHDFTVTIGNVNTLVKLSMADNSSNTATVTTAGTNVIVTCGSNASNVVTVNENFAWSFQNPSDMPVEINGGTNASNTITLNGSGIINGGANASNMITANNGIVAFIGGDNGSNTFMAGTGQYYLLGGDNAYNDFKLGGGFNFVVGGDSSGNVYEVSDAGCGVIIYGANGSDTVISESATSLNDYRVIPNFRMFQCGVHSYGDSDYGDDSHNDSHDNDHDDGHDNGHDDHDGH